MATIVNIATIVITSDIHLGHGKFQLIEKQRISLKSLWYLYFL